MVEVSDALGSTCLSTEDDCSNKFDFFVSVIDDKVEAILRFSNSVERVIMNVNFLDVT